MAFSISPCCSWSSSKNALCCGSLISKATPIRCFWVLIEAAAVKPALPIAKFVQFWGSGFIAFKILLSESTRFLSSVQYSS